MTETEAFLAVGIVLSDETSIVALGHTPTPPCNKAFITKILESATSHGEITAGIVHDIATTYHFTRIGIDGKTHQTRVLGIMTITIVEEGQGVAILQLGVMLAIEALILILVLTIDTPKDTACTVFNLDEGTDGTEGAKPVFIREHLHSVEVYIVIAGIEEGTGPLFHLRMVGAPPIEHHLAIIHLLQISHGKLATIHLTLYV